MSYCNFAALSWACDTNTTGLPRLLLLDIARRVNPAGQCWPSVATLAAVLDVSPRQCRRLLAQLENTGWIRRLVDNGRGSILEIPALAASGNPPNGRTPHPSRAVPTPDMGVRGPATDPGHGCPPPPDMGVRGTPDTGVRRSRDTTTRRTERVKPAASRRSPANGTGAIHDAASRRDRPVEVPSEEKSKPARSCASGPGPNGVSPAVLQGVKGSRSRRSAERLDIAAAFEALKAMWKVEADAPITRERFPKEADAWSHIRARACQLARTHGAKRFLDEIRAEIESNERRPPSRRLTLEALLERLIRKEH